MPAGFIAALGAELATGQTIFQQFEAAPKAIVATFALFAVATLVSSLDALPDVVLGAAPSALQPS